MGIVLTAIVATLVASAIAFKMRSNAVRGADGSKSTYFRTDVPEDRC